MAESPLTPDPAHADLLAAAKAARAWARQRRAAWGAPELPPPAVTRVPVAPANQTIAFTEQPEEQPPEVAPPERPKKAKRRTVNPARVVAVFSDLRDRAAGLAAFARRALLALAAVAVVAGAVWAIRANWRPVMKALTSGTVVLDSVPEGSDVTMDGAALGQTPMTREVPTGRHVFEFHRGSAVRTVAVDVPLRRQAAASVDWTKKPTGRLRVQSDPRGAHVVIDGRERGVTPITLDDLTVGAHTVVLSTSSGSVQRTVTIAQDQTEQISESIYAGWVHISSPIEVTISEGSRELSPDERNEVMLDPGPHTLRLESRFFGYEETRRIDVKPGERTELVVTPPTSPLTVTATLPSQVLVDGVEVGATPLTNYPVRVGARDITVRAATGAERHVTITVRSMPVRVDIDFSRP